MIELTFDRGHVAVVRKWWNSRWGRLARLDIRLTVQWKVEALIGGAEGRTKHWEFDDEDKALAWIDHLMATGGDGWKEVT